MPRTKKTGTAVLLIDVINRFDFPGAEPLTRTARAVAPRIEALAKAARSAGVPVIYVNDNFGQWTSDFTATVAECTREDARGRDVCERLRPHEGDYFVLKPQHSGFYGTPLELLLEHLAVHTVVLAGFAADICVAFTANDAHMRGYHVVAPRDAVAANSRPLSEAALRHFRETLGASTPLVSSVSFAAFRRRKKKERGQTF